MAGKFEIFLDKVGEFRFRLKAANGQIILASEGYTTKASVLNGIESVRKNSQRDEMFQRAETTQGKPRFNLKASNGQVIGTSETYESTTARDKYNGARQWYPFRCKKCSGSGARRSDRLIETFQTVQNLPDSRFMRVHVMPRFVAQVSSQVSIASNWSMKPEIMLRPLSQNAGSEASRPKGASSSL